MQFVLEGRYFKREVDEYRPGRPEPVWLDVHRERKRGKHVTLQLLWLEYRQAHADGWGDTQFCAHTTTAGSSVRTSSCDWSTRLGSAFRRFLWRYAGASVRSRTLASPCDRLDMDGASV
jgi:hypothetical protein